MDTNKNNTNIQILERFSYYLEQFNKGVLIVSLAVLVVSVVLQVFLRMIFKTAFVPLSDIISYSFPITTFSGAPLLFKQFDGHIAITFFTDLLKGKVKTFVLVIAEIMVFAVLVFILIWGTIFALNGLHQYSPALNIKMIYFFIIVPIFALSSIVFRIETLINLKRNNQSL